jgi:hypothetical protein
VTSGPRVIAPCSSANPVSTQGALRTIGRGSISRGSEFWVITLITYVVDLGDFSHVVAGEGEAWLWPPLPIMYPR